MGGLKASKEKFQLIFLKLRIFWAKLEVLIGAEKRGIGRKEKKGDLA